MSEGKDPAIKLFGKTIQLPDGVFSQEAVSGDAAGGGGAGGDAASVKSEDRSSSSSSSSEVGEERESDDNNKDQSNDKSADKDENRAHSTISSEITDPNATSMITDTTKTPSPENESATASATTKASKSEEDQSDTSNNNQEKTLKKPDKILPCPRCNSMDTKFCYYNNYNVNQPRHFCKNCQRYWTAGGTMRNVPVGAGRRKNKTSASQYRQITVSDSSLPIELNHTVLNPNGTVLTFGSDTPLCESMASVLKIADKTMIRKPEELIINDDNTNRPSVNDMQSCHGFSPQVPCFPGGPPPWGAPYPWTPQMGPAFCPPGFPMPFYPAGPYWGCPVPVPVSVSIPGPYWVPPPGNYHPAPPSGPISPTLGKHSRDENVKCGESEEVMKENESEKSLWIPKTLRIDDPDEAAKSSIWATLGIKKDGSVPVNRGGIFKAFESKNEEKKMIQETSTSPALQANPAALSRSLNFQESS
ncbi:cyclic dof factor 1 [Lactuca sativa]|uniref:Dof-type domain-containing protein n=1 Tax=Lactuca sativa TaxID=4236 RepID=A0A9R1WBK1_LACSA|nr:cyclic dof factor 1 [Lactuca sativa]KAJ0222095.1 hypothetical protein LSAT_V11C200082830 [Lactuca sativa]